jgi:3-hydroxyacyl-CoA dehydrogenase
MNTTENQKRVAVIGSGLMGHGIAQDGGQVTMNDTDESVLKNARERIRLNLKALSEAGLEEEGRIEEIRLKLLWSMLEKIKDQ